MDLEERYRFAVERRLGTDLPRLDSLPSILCGACVEVLDVAAAGLSMTQTVRLPLGASDADATLLEEIQTTLGDGPCLSASDVPIVSDATAIAERWPVFATEMHTRSMLRSAVSLPLLYGDGRRFGALDMFSSDPSGADLHAMLPSAPAVARYTLARLVMAVDTGTIDEDAELPAWLDSDIVTKRMQVWPAIGLVSEATGLSPSDTLALLRSYAHGQNRTLDQTASDLVSRRLSAAQLVAGADAGSDESSEDPELEPDENAS